MTALTKFQRLEATGLWRPDAEAQRREVIVSLGDATLTMSSTAGDILAHWSLGAVQRSNGHALPAIYHPEGAPEETLELGADETEMIAGLDRLLRAIDRRRPRPGKLRFIVTGSAVALGLVLAVFWLPGALASYATTVVPQVKRAEIGARLLSHVTRLTGQACNASEAREPLRRFSQRIQQGGSVVVLPGGSFTSAHLPGSIILLNRRVVEDHDDPDVAAGFALVESMRVRASDPLGDLLAHAGLIASLRLLTTGEMPDSALDAYAEHVMTHPQPAPHVENLLEAFAKAELRTSPYAYAVDGTGESTLPLIEADPRRIEGSRMVLSDADWVRLQAICNG
ncbi:hypothetical protein [Sagittula salina]|uniref:Uncharacterized protein n=1 Tax=Sagittula salina TaxID=2820268 RepID=A0A940MRS8_9RHOB|nr:hypothetical protein [Sagittula salina]MBP0483832.1 hypothetical protein [Sagittula salina]